MNKLFKYLNYAIKSVFFLVNQMKNIKSIKIIYEFLNLEFCSKI